MRCAYLCCSAHTCVCGTRVRQQAVCARTCEVLRALRQLRQVHVLRQKIVLHQRAGVDLEDLQAALFVGQADLDLELDAPWPRERLIEQIGPVGHACTAPAWSAYPRSHDVAQATTGGTGLQLCAEAGLGTSVQRWRDCGEGAAAARTDEQDVVERVHAVDLGQQRVDDAVVHARAAAGRAAGLADRVDLVKDDHVQRRVLRERRLVALRVRKQLAHLLLGLADVLVQDLGPVDHFWLDRVQQLANLARDQRLACARSRPLRVGAVASGRWARTQADSREADDDLSACERSHLVVCRSDAFWHVLQDVLRRRREVSGHC